MKKTDKKIKNVLAVLKSTGGNVSKACEANNISRTAFYNWMDEDEEFAKDVEDIQESVADNVESALYRTAIEGHVTAQIFFLKNKRPDKWADRKDIHLEDLTSSPVDLSEDEKQKYDDMLNEDG